MTGYYTAYSYVLITPCLFFFNADGRSPDSPDALGTTEWVIASTRYGGWLRVTMKTSRRGAELTTLFCSDEKGGLTMAKHESRVYARIVKVLVELGVDSKKLVALLEYIFGD